MRPPLAGALLLASLLGGCLPSEDQPAPQWAYLHTAIIAPSCTTASCHSAATALAGINLSDIDGSYTVLTGRICGEPDLPLSPPRNYVTPGSADYSQLIYQLRGADAAGRPYRDVMPPDTKLPDREIELIATWIDNGALCD